MKMARNWTYVVLGKERLRVIVAVDVDLGKRVEQSGILLSTGHLALHPRKDQLEPVPLLNLFDELLNREDTNNASEQVLDGRLVAVNIQETTDDLRSPRGVNTLDVHLDELCESVLVQVEDEVVNEVESVADDDEGELVRELGFLEEILDLLGVVEVALSAETLDFTDLASSGGSLNVLEVYLGVLAEVDDGAEVVVKTFEALERLEHLNQLDGAEDVRVLGRNLDDNLKVLAHVDTEHLVHAGE